MLFRSPQTSGGLLVACTPDAVTEVMKTFERHGFAKFAEVGQLKPVAETGPRLVVN